MAAEGPKAACATIREDLLGCFAESKCIQDGGRLEDCLRTKDTALVPERCQKLVRLLAECRRAQIDGRYRFKGPPS